MEKNDKIRLGPLSLMREAYRSLLYTGRSYAAFERDEAFPLAQALSNHCEILDPMSGYGTLMSYCSELGIRSFCLEYSLPLYLWQLLTTPGNSEVLIEAASRLLSKKRNWPRSSLLGTVSDDWFPEESKRLLLKLLKLNSAILKDLDLESKKEEKLSLALLLPFVGRIATCVPGNIAYHVKIGGMCVYRGWHDDYTTYLQALIARLKDIKFRANSVDHTVEFGDCQDEILPVNRFSAMLTSPPYPNHRDFYTMFGPENAFLNWLYKDKIITLLVPHKSNIGSNYVSGIPTPVVRTMAAKRFLEALEKYDGSRRAKYDIKVYYLPYFSHYFSGLEKAFNSISRSLRKDFEGYIISVDNTARDQVIPVASTILEIWTGLGYKAEIFNKKEKFHIGTKNPRARGFKAKHWTYTIKVSSR